LRNRHVLADTELILIESVAASLQTGNATMEHCITEMKMQGIFQQTAPTTVKISRDCLHKYDQKPSLTKIYY
jgi:hypothetical protein